MKPAVADKSHINRFKIAHMVAVAEYMRENAVRYGLDPDEMYVLGLLHDIGYLQGKEEHEEAGYALLSQFGCKKNNNLFAIRYHGSNPNDLIKKGILDPNNIPKEYILLLEGDLSVNAQGYKVGFTKRLKDIGERYGFNSIAYETALKTVDFIKSLDY